MKFARDEMDAAAAEAKRREVLSSQAMTTCTIADIASENAELIGWAYAKACDTTHQSEAFKANDFGRLCMVFLAREAREVADRINELRLALQSDKKAAAWLQEFDAASDTKAA